MLSVAAGSSHMTFLPTGSFMDLEDAKKVVAEEASKLKEDKTLQIQKDWLLGNVVPFLELVFFPFIRCPAS